MEEQQEAVKDAENKRLKQELEELRSQLTKSASVVGDYGELRREVDKSERIRTQLSDHIQVGNVLLSFKVPLHNLDLFVTWRNLHEEQMDAILKGPLHFGASSKQLMNN